MLRPGSFRARRVMRPPELRSYRRAEQARIVAGLQPLLEEGEQLLGFALGRVVGGMKGKLNVGPEALVEPYVNVGLTEKRLIVQHIPMLGASRTGLEGKMKSVSKTPHLYPLDEIGTMEWAPLETFGPETAGRLIVRMQTGLTLKFRHRGSSNAKGGEAIAEVFSALTASRPEPAHSPLWSACPLCSELLDSAYRFCPYCGGALQEGASAENSAETGEEEK